MYDKVKILIDDARKIITPNVRWTQGMWARDVDGNEVEPTSEHAVCFCALGAVQRAFFDAYGVNVGDMSRAAENPANAMIYYTALDLLSVGANHVFEDMGEEDKAAYEHKVSLVEFNDSERHSSVLSVFEFAAETAEELHEDTAS